MPATSTTGSTMRQHDSHSHNPQAVITIKKTTASSGQQVQQPPRTPAGGPKVQEGHQQHHQAAEAEEQHSHHLAFQPVDVERCGGSCFRAWNMKRKYHSGLIPAGAEPKGSAFCPSSQGNKAARAARMARARYQPTMSRSRKWGTKGMLGTFFAPPHRCAAALRDADPVLLHQEQVQPDQRQGRQGQNDHVQGVEAGQGVAGDVFAAAGQ